MIVNYWYLDNYPKLEALLILFKCDFGELVHL